MKYMGSKARHARELTPIVLANRKPGQWYFEPFLGGGNMMAGVDAKGNQLITGLRCGTDTNAAVVELLCKVRDGWVPPDTITEEQYGRIKAAPSEYAPEVVAFAAICCAFGGQWFGTYARGKNAQGEPRNYAREGRDHLLKQAPRLKGAHMFAGSYDAVSIPQGAIIYCDPPYADTTYGYDKRAAGAKFDHKAFWQWCEAKARAGHEVFVSEYTAPANWTPVWSKNVTVSIDSGRKAGKVRENVERLWVLND